MVAGVLVVALAVVGPLAVVARWAQANVSDTDRWVDTVAPLAREPAVQDAVTERVSDEILSRLPPRAAAAVRDVVSRQVGSIVRSDAFAEAWRTANRRAHPEVVAVLTDRPSDVANADDGSLSISLGPIAEAVRDRLVERGVPFADRLPDVDVDLTVVRAADVARARTAFRALDTLSVLLPLVAVACLVAAVVVARSRLRTVAAGGLALAVGALLLTLALTTLRSAYLDAARPEQLPRAAAAAIYDRLADSVGGDLRVLAYVALAASLVALLADLALRRQARMSTTR